MISPFNQTKQYQRPGKSTRCVFLKNNLIQNVNSEGTKIIVNAKINL